jgi:hypothetical protein
MKSNSVMTCAADAGVLTWTFADGKTVAFDTKAVAKNVRAEATVHGFRQKIADAAAMSRDTETGLPATVEQKRAAMESVIQNLNAGLWNAPAGGGNEGGLLLAALIRIKPEMSEENLKKWLAGKSDKEKAALRIAPSIKPEIDKIRAERGKATGLDGDDILKTLV